MVYNVIITIIVIIIMHADPILECERQDGRAVRSTSCTKAKWSSFEVGSRLDQRKTMPPTTWSSFATRTAGKTRKKNCRASYVQFVLPLRVIAEANPLST